MLMTDDNVPRLAPGYRLQWEDAQNCHVLLYPEGMVKLNRSAGEILVRCDGATTLAQVVEHVEVAFDTGGLRSAVERFLRLAAAQRWIVLR
jgi:pyrroloquinoline quinone biosynthesis protein D